MVYAGTPATPESAIGTDPADSLSLGPATGAPLDATTGVTPIPLGATGRPHRSPIDAWCQGKWQLNADQLTDEGQKAELAGYLLKCADQRKEFWSKRNQRFLKHQRMIDMKVQEAGENVRALGKDPLNEPVTDNEEILVLPDCYLYVHKVVNMLSEADLNVDMPANDVDSIMAAQRVEGFLRWWLEQQNDAWALGAHSDLKRDVTNYEVSRGWITAMLMTDSENPNNPWQFELEDPRHVYPRYSRRRLTQVFRVYQATVFDAVEEYPELAERFAGLDENKKVEVLGYYDEKYHAILVNQEPLVKADNSGAAPLGPAYPGGQFVKFPVAHGLRDFAGEPYVPWIIVTPTGNTASADEDGEVDTTNVGQGILFGAEEVYFALCRIASMLLTNAAMSQDPPVAHYIDPSNPNTQEIKFKPRARNYFAYDREKVQILSTTVDPGTMNPLMGILNDRANKAFLPSVFWGDAGAVTSGYGVGLLQGAARDILSPYSKGLRLFYRLLFRRVLETYQSIVLNTVGEVEFITRSSFSGARVLGQTIKAEDLKKTGVQADVKIGEYTPQDKMALGASMLQLVTGGVYTKFRARKELGVNDPMAEERWRAFEAILADPAIALMVAEASVTMSDDELMKFALQKKLEREQQLAAQNGGANNGGGGQGPGAPAPLPTSAVPLQQQIGEDGLAGLPPPKNDPAAQQQREQNDTVARLSGGSQPAS